jgi:hypothetical protein
LGSDEFISATTIITLLIIVLTESGHAVLTKYFPTVAEVRWFLFFGVLSFALFIIIRHTFWIARKYHPVARLTAILCAALAVESFANYVIKDYGLWPSFLITLVVIYVLTWFGYAEPHKMKAI